MDHHTDRKPHVIVTYVPEERDFAKRLVKQIDVLNRANRFTRWTSDGHTPGSNILRELEAQIERADIALILLSPDSAASEPFIETVVSPLFRRNEQREIFIVPIVVREFQRSSDPMLVGLQLLPRNGKAILSCVGDALDEALAEIASEVEAMIDRLSDSELLTTGVFPVQLDNGLADAQVASGNGRLVRSPQALRAPVVGKSRRARAKNARAADPAAYQNCALIMPEQRADAPERRRRLKQVGEDTTAVDAEILAQRRREREGLWEGEELGNGRYLLLKRVGRGGFGSVWKARDKIRSQDVAIKVMRGNSAEERERRERISRGARIMSDLGHDAVVQVLEQPVVEGRWYYFVMEFLPGGNLQQAVLGGRISEGEAIDIILRIGDALATAHDREIVHRDVKPANILLDADGKAKLTDFDLVLAPHTTAGTATGAMMGTMGYAAPELMTHAATADARADVYGLAMTAVFALRGQDLSYEVIDNRNDLVNRLECRTPIKNVLKKAVASNPSDRYNDARAFCEALESAWAESIDRRRPSDEAIVKATERQPGKLIVRYDCLLLGLGYAEPTFEIVAKAVHDWNERVGRRFKAEVVITLDGALNERTGSATDSLEEPDLGIVIVTPKSTTGADALRLDTGAKALELRIRGAPIRVYIDADHSTRTQLAYDRRCRVEHFSQIFGNAGLLYPYGSAMELRDTLLSHLSEIVGQMPRTVQMAGDVTNVSALDIKVDIVACNEPATLFESKRVIVVSVKNQSDDVIHIKRMAFETIDGTEVLLDDEDLTRTLSMPRDVAPRETFKLRVRHEQWGQLVINGGRRPVRAVVVDSFDRKFRSGTKQVGAAVP